MGAPPRLFYPWTPPALGFRRVLPTKPGSLGLEKPWPGGSAWAGSCPPLPSPSSPPGGCGRGTRRGCAGQCCSASAPLPAPCEASPVMSRGCISPWRTVRGERERENVSQGPGVCVWGGVVRSCHREHFGGLLVAPAPRWHISRAEPPWEMLLQEETRVAVPPAGSRRDLPSPKG